MTQGRPSVPIEEKLARATHWQSDIKTGILSSVYAGVLSKEPPADLNDSGKALWSQIVECLPEHLLRNVDSTMLLALCRMWQNYEELYEAFDNAKIGTPKYFKLHKAVLDMFDKYMKIADKFGMSPGARSRLKHPPVKKNAEEDPLNRMRTVRAKQTA